MMFNIQKIARTLGKTIYLRSASFSSSPASAPASVAKKSPPTIEQNRTYSPSQSESVAILQKSKNPLVAAAFESLLSKEDEQNFRMQDNETNDQKNKLDQVDKQILNANTVQALLSVTDMNVPITRKHALKVVSILAEWSTINRAKLSDFENDPKFIKLCRLLGRTITKNNEKSNDSKKIIGFRTEDLNTVISVAGDDEAAKLVASISIPQMIKVMSTLAQKKRRSTPLLRSIAYNITSNTETLDLKLCADLLYAMAILNFPDSVLIGRVSIDIQNGLCKTTDKPAAIGSIITSLGLLKYRDADLLESLTDWLLNYSDVCRPQDISSFFLTLATLNYPTTKANMLKTKFANALVKNDFPKLSDWLTHVWAMVVLDFAEPTHFESVLNKHFLEKLIIERGGDLAPTIKKKLLNINAAIQLLSSTYTGSRLDERSSIFSVPLVGTKNKQILVNGLVDALKSLFTSEKYLRLHYNTNMGFVIDAECVLDKKRKPLSVTDNHKDDVTRYAIMVLDFHDMCQGAHQQPNGINGLAFRLLEKQNYTILSVPYNEFNTSDKLLKRVQYLDEKFKRTSDGRK